MSFDAHDVTIKIPLGAQRSTSQQTANWRIDIPADPRIEATLRAQLQYILINRDGPSIQPGSRSYERSWIRDGRSEEHTSELQSQSNLVCRLLPEKKKANK